MIPIHVSHSVSPRAQQLGRKIAETIEAYRREHGAVDGMELRQALKVAQEQTAAKTPPAFFLLLAVLLGGILAAAIVSRSTGGDAPVVLMVLLSAAILFLIFTAIKRN